MKQDNPFAKLGSLDQQLYKDTSPKSIETPVEIPRKPENLKAGIPDNPKTSLPEITKAGKPESSVSRKPEYQKSRIPETLKAEKYSTQLDPSLIKRVKQYAIG